MVSGYIYVSDQSSTQNSRVVDYVDNKINSFSNTQYDLTIASRNLQSHLNLLSEWYEKRYIKLNHYITFTLKHNGP